MSFLNFLFGPGTEVVKETTNVVLDSAERIKTLITGNLPPDKVAEFEVEMAKIQGAINLEEAKHSSLFVAGWRPFIGWICGASFGVYFIPRSIVSAWMWVKACLYANAIVPYPEMGVADLMSLLFALLGLGAYRTYEKAQGVNRRS